MLDSLSEHELLVFWVELLALFAVARFGGYLFRRIGLPTVIGHLGAGVVLGPSVFGKIFPSGFEWFLGDGHEIQSGALLAIAWMGIALLLIITGFETDLGLIMRLGRAATLVSWSSLLVPLAAGLAVGFALPDVFRSDLGIAKWVFALFVGTALGVSSLAVVARILSELGLMRRDFGQITVAAGMANDLVGWLMLGLLAALASPDGFDAIKVIRTVLAMALFIGLALTLGQRVVDYMLRQVRKEGENIGGAITVALLVALTFAVITQWIGVEGVLGTFIAGVVIARSRFQQEAVIEHLEVITYSFFAPLFFATAGLRVDLSLLLSSEVIVWALIVLVVAIVAKFAGAFGGARLAGLTSREGVALGGGLNARGALEIVIATVGLSLGVFSDTAYATIVMVPMVTSLFAALVLRASVRNWQGTDAERERLELEETLSKNLVVRNQRVLLPSRGGRDSIVAAQVAHFAWPSAAPFTVLSGGADGEAIEPIRNVLFGRDVDVAQVDDGDDLAARILAESHLGYGAIAMGAGALRPDGRLLSPVIDDILFSTSVPLVIVRRPPETTQAMPGFFTRALVPVSGSPASKAAQEIAYNISNELGTQIVLHHAVSRPGGGLGPTPMPMPLTAAELRDTAAEKVVSQAEAAAAAMGIRVRTDIRSGPIADTLVQAGRETQADLIVVGSAVRRLDDRPFLGHTTEHILESSSATVVIVIVPPK